MQKLWRQRWPTIIAGLLLTTAGLRAQTLDEIRDQIRQDLDPGTFASLVAGFVSIDLFPQVSSGTFKVENDDPRAPDSRIDTFKFPFQWNPKVGNLPGELYLGGGFGYLKETDSVILDLPVNGNIVSSQIDSISTAYNAMGTVGWTFDLGGGFGIRPVAGLAYSRVENEGRYDAVGNIIWKPLLDGIVLNWKLQAYTISAGASLLYRQSFDWGRMEGDLNYMHTWTKVFDATDISQEGEVQNDFLAARLDFVYRTGEKIWENPLDFRIRTGLFQILTPNVDPLGFKTLAEVGLGAELDLSDSGLPLSRIGFMGSFFAGQRTQGWSLGITFEL